MKITFKDFITESDAFTKAVADLKNDPYEEPTKTENGQAKTTKEVKIEKIQKVFDPVKWRKYLQYANAGNN